MTAARAGRARTVRVGPLDVLHGRSRITAVLGPVRVPDPDLVAARLRALIAAGPHTRLGLRPTGAGTRWRYDPATLPEIVTAEAPASPESLLVDARHTAGSDGRTRIVLAGDYLLTDHDHGLGEVELTLTYHAVALGTLDPHDPGVWRAARRRGAGIPTAVARTFASDPRRLWRLAGTLDRPGVDAAPRESVPWAPSRAGAVATFDRATLARLRDWRDRHDPAVSMFSVTAAVLHRALTAAGLAAAPTISVPFDARRYLPAGRVPLGNFVAGLDFRVGVAPTPRAIHDAVARAGAVGRPVANLAVNAARTRGALLGGARFDAPGARPRHPRARLLFSSIGTVPRHGTVPWLDTARPFYAAHNDPTGPEGITFTWGTVDGRTIVVGSFHDNVFPAATVAAALQRAAADPLALLGATARADPRWPDPRFPTAADVR